MSATETATQWLEDNVSEEDWECLVGRQSREEFAKAALCHWSCIECAWDAYLDFTELL